ncbi:O-antigen ligase family protein [Streptacidiphilus rugosus]|uniref:O-antigen ligase family protein n=1 Tax=Streptacidiphilus rugosus TaxID=405783 RepID=UPI00055D3965|nr:O-antigen ligase family protein [Streptacidiphilus rugosus]
MRDRPTVAAERLTSAALWALGLGPAFFAVVVWDRSEAVSGNDPIAGLVPAEAPPAPWRVGVGEAYQVATAALLIGVLVAYLARPRGRGRPAGAALVASGLAMYAGPMVSALLGGHGGAGDWRLYLAPLMIGALYAAPDIPPAELLWRLRVMVRVYTWGSLAALVVAPDWALASSQIVNFRLPGLGISRLVGLTNHPILLGVLAAAALAVELAPLHRGRLWPLHSCAAAAVLVLAQSRTAWMAAALAIPLLYRRGGRDRFPPLLARGLVLGILVGAGVLVPSLLRRFGQIMSDPEITSLHGRTEVWAMAMTAFRSDILLGYGPTLFTDASSPVHGLYAHAHSQLHQTLATSGLVGLVGLVLFVLFLVVTAARTARASAGLSWALLVVTLVTCMTEAPLRGVEFTPYLLLVLVDVAFLLTMTRSVEAEPVRIASGPLSAPGGHRLPLRSGS